MNKTIIISTILRAKKAKQAQVDRCYEQRHAQILKHQEHYTFTELEWISAWKCGWLRQHGLSLYCHPSPVKHRRKLFRYSNEPYFKNWREEVKERHEEWRGKCTNTG